MLNALEFKNFVPIITKKEHIFVAPLSQIVVTKLQSNLNYYEQYFLRSF